MKPTELENSFLLRQFQDFYREVIAQKTAIVQAAEGPKIAPQSGAEDTAKEGLHAVQIRLMRILEEQVLESRRRGGEYGVNYYRKAQYVMAALADEIFLHMRWEGRDLWKSNLLEFKFFGTHVAGEVVFEKIEALLRERDPAMIEIAAVYQLVLALGFRGKFRDRDDGGQIDHFRSQLYTFIFHRNPDLFNSGKLLFSDAYDYTLDQGEGKRLPYMRRWIGVIVLLIVVFLGVSHGIWEHSTRDLVDIAEDIISGSNSLNR
ncbi:MAG: DotU family type IV/VI secretion system protein [Desulfobacterales bacterium]|nr:DotU family type IV/VI secretion system protein [Desulfobacterales bacterium]